MNPTADPEHDTRPGPLTRSGGSGRSGRPSRGVAAAIAAALLAGAGVAWLTRPSGPELSPEVGADRSLVVATSSGGPGSAPPTTGARPGSSGSPSRVGASVATPTARSAAPAAGSTRTPSPDRMTISRLGVDMRVVAVGVAPDGEMALPATPAEVGWYRYGPRPGEDTGSTVLAAHLDMPGYGVGPIAAVEELRRGDVITVRSGPATSRYAVTSVTSIRKTSLDLGALFARDGPARLHVVTCGGDFDREKRRYDSNVVVTAVPTA